MSGDMLIVAFDGLDYQLLQEYGCSQFTGMHEFGRIDNDTDIPLRVTEQLFAAFITGTVDNNITQNITYYPQTKKGRLAGILAPRPKWKKRYRGTTRYHAVMEAILGVDQIVPRADYLDCPTIFDKIEDSIAQHVPGYYQGPVSDCFLTVLDRGYGIDYAKRQIRMGFEKRKEELFEMMENPPQLAMTHIWYPDHVQHVEAVPGDQLYSSRTAEGAKDEIAELYREMNDLAERIKERATDQFDTVLFMSDHGVPEEFEHNTNAFYSSSEEIFPSKTPHITDFHDKIYSAIGREEEKEIGELDI